MTKYKRDVLALLTEIRDSLALLTAVPDEHPCPHPEDARVCSGTMRHKQFTCKECHATVDVK